MDVLLRWMEKISGIFILHDRDDFIEMKKPTDEEILDQAHEELLQAQNLFARVTDREMIDYAIYILNATETRYGYLIKGMKKERSHV